MYEIDIAGLTWQMMWLQWSVTYIFVVGITSLMVAYVYRRIQRWAGVGLGVLQIGMMTHIMLTVWRMF